MMKTSVNNDIGQLDPEAGVMVEGFQFPISVLASCCCTGDTCTTLAKKIETATRQRAQARDLSSMHAPVVDVRACLNFFGQGSSSIG